MTAASVTLGMDGHARDAIDAHFTGRSSAPGELAMRAHLQLCLACSHYYDRRVLLGSLDPRGMPAGERLARALGLGRAAWTSRGGGASVSLRRPRLRYVLSSAALAAAALAVIVTTNRLTGEERPAASAPEFGARGTGVPRQMPPLLWVYRVAADGSPAPLAEVIGADDELAFAYGNPTGIPYLVIFGVDEHRHVYWFHPAWPVGAPPPSSVRAAAGVGPHELPEAVRHAIDGARLELYTVFSQRPLGVAEIEARVRRGAGRPGFDGGEGVTVLHRALQVRR